MRIKCPKCGSGNIIGYAGEMECFNCGHKFKIAEEVKPARIEPTVPPPKTRDASAGIRLAVMLIVGLIVGIGIGYVLHPGPQVVTKVETITQTVPTTVTETQTFTTTLTTTVVSLTTITYRAELPVKAEWTTGNGRLRVSSELIPEKIGEEVWSYRVKVVVTNVGNEPVMKVLVIIFPYVGDKLFEQWNWASHSATATGLMPGESFTHEFLLLPKDMTSYKLAAFAL